MKIIEKIDKLVSEACGNNLPPDELLRLQREIAGYRYHMSEVVADLSRKAMQSEVDRKTLFAKAKMAARADHLGQRALSNDAATEAAEQRPEVIRSRAEEIMAQAEYEALKMKLNTSGDVLMSLQMRIANARDEMKQTRMISVH